MLTLGSEFLLDTRFLIMCLIFYSFADVLLACMIYANEIDNLIYQILALLHMDHSSSKTTNNLLNEMLFLIIEHVTKLNHGLWGTSLCHMQNVTSAQCKAQ